MEQILPAGRLRSAVLATLADLGPSPTAFRASPSADFECDGHVKRTAPGWWLAYAAQLRVTSSLLSDTQEELVELRFHGARVHNGEPITWSLSTATDVYGVRRLVLHDQATYPEPLLNMLQYHAIGQCREHLLQQTALRLGQQLSTSGGPLRAVVNGVLAALGLYREKTLAAAAGEPRTADPMPAAPRYPNLAPLQPPTTQHQLDETPRGVQPSVLSAIAAKIATARSSAPPTRRQPDVSLPAAEAFAAASAHAAAVAASSSATGVVATDDTNGALCDDSAQASTGAADLGVSALVEPWGGDAAAAEWGVAPVQPRFAGTTDSALTDAVDSTVAERALALSRSGLELQPPGAHASEEDQVDSLRAKMPDRSTDTLREIVRGRHRQ